MTDLDDVERLATAARRCGTAALFEWADRYDWFNLDCSQEDLDFIRAMRPELAVELIESRRIWRSAHATLNENYDKIYLELNALRKDAERYQARMETVRYLLGTFVPSDEELDIAIDAANRSRDSQA